MYKSLITAIGLVASGMLWQVYAASMVLGQPLNKADSVEINQLLADPQHVSGQTITVHGIVSEVCRKKGCWLQFKTATMAPLFRLEVNDGEMVFPVSARGKTAYATGQLQVDNLTLQQTQDYLANRAMEQGRDFDVTTITQPITIYRLRPQAVLID